jgi:hypothetical protein
MITICITLLDSSTNSGIINSSNDVSTVVIGINSLGNLIYMYVFHQLKTTSLSTSSVIHHIIMDLITIDGCMISILAIKVTDMYIDKSDWNAVLDSIIIDE